MMAVVMAVMMMVTGSSRGFANGSAEDESCCDHGERRPRPGSSPRHRFFVFHHIYGPSNSIATYVASGAPSSFAGRPLTS